jgi:hypothetical protein
MGSPSIEYVVRVSFSNIGATPVVFDTVRAIFFSEAGGGHGMTTVKTDGGSWQLSRSKQEDFTFHTNGYTGQILADARGAPILFAVKLLRGGEVVAGPFLAELPALHQLPSEYSRGEHNYALHFKTVEMPLF